MEIIRTDDKHIIKDFLEMYWKHNHSLIKSDSLLEFQHLCPEDSKYNYYILVDGTTVWGVLGYIPTSQYDPNLYHEKDVWGAIWKIRDDCPIKGVGLELMDKLLSDYKTFAAVGISKVAKKIYRLYGMSIGELSQYYIANPNTTQPEIGCNLKSSMAEINNTHWTIKPIIDITGVESIISTYKPKKSINYLITRYQNHPIYKYIFWCICKGEAIVSIWVLRRMIVGKASIFKIVDMYGNIEDVPNLAKQIQDELIKETVEYVDCLNYGIDAKVFERIGFTKLDYNSDTILPNYFEPFEKCNVKIECAVKADVNYVIFKGDSDQDRPNIL